MNCPNCRISMTSKSFDSIEWECTFGCGLKLTEGHFSDMLRARQERRSGITHAGGEATYAVPVDRFPPQPLPKP